MPFSLEWFLNHTSRILLHITTEESMPNLKSMAATNPLSPSIPVPDPNAFQAKLGQSDKKRLLLSTYSRCPSPPSKSPPHSRVVNSSRDLYTPFARSLVPSTPYLTTPEQSICKCLISHCEPFTLFHCFLIASNLQIAPDCILHSLFINTLLLLIKHCILFAF